jgi:uncharacterized repeat protein (TIGR01451 family)
VTKNVTDLNGPPVQIGDILRYLVTVTPPLLPPGGAGFTYKDSLPDPDNHSVTEYVQIVDCHKQNAPSTCSYSPSLHQISVGGGKLSAQGLVVEYDLRVACASGFSIQNQGTMSIAGYGSCLSDADPMTLEKEPTQIDICFPDIRKSRKTARDLNGGVLNPNDVVEFTITVTNSGCAPAPQTVVKDAVDTAHLVNIQPGSGGTYAGGVVTWQAGDVGVGQQASVTFQAQVQCAVGDSIFNKAQAESAFWQGNPNCFFESNELQLVCGEAFRELGATKTMDDANGGDLNPGDELVYQIRVENTGVSGASNVTVVDRIDPNIENLLVPTGNVSRNTILWDQTTEPALAMINPGDSVVLWFAGTLSCAVADETAIYNSDWSVWMNEPGTVTRVDPPCLTAKYPDYSQTSKTIDLPYPPPGRTAHYRVNVCNQGAGTGNQVVVTDTLDPWLNENTIVAPGATVAGGLITWVVPSLGPGTVSNPTCETHEFWVDLDADAPVGEELCNSVEVTSEEWASCGRKFASAPICFTIPNPPEDNELERNTCTAIPYDLSSLPWPPPAFFSIPLPAACADDPESGILTDSGKPLVFYQVRSSTDPDSVRCIKNTTDLTVTICY